MCEVRVAKHLVFFKESAFHFPFNRLVSLNTEHVHTAMYGKMQLFATIPRAPLFKYFGTLLFCSGSKVHISPILSSEFGSARDCAVSNRGSFDIGVI